MRCSIWIFSSLMSAPGFVLLPRHQPLFEQRFGPFQIGFGIGQLGLALGHRRTHHVERRRRALELLLELIVFEHGNQIALAHEIAHLQKQLLYPPGRLRHHVDLLLGLQRPGDQDFLSYGRNLHPAHAHRHDLGAGASSPAGRRLRAGVLLLIRLPDAYTPDRSERNQDRQRDQKLPSAHFHPTLAAGRRPECRFRFITAVLCVCSMYLSSQTLGS
ncbi:MAG: hypothetical protein HYZ57_05405, partial [Acidobacteria bacterium]|nr:hypothetical protein [Acidobacteriota bacterium]